MTKLSIRALLAGQSLAQPPQGEAQNAPPGQRPSVEQPFQDMDQNKDQKLSKSEVMGPFQREFSQLDTNKDGLLSKQEVRTGGERKPSQR